MDVLEQQEDAESYLYKMIYERHWSSDGVYVTNLIRTHKNLGLHSARRENDIYLTTPR